MSIFFLALKGLSGRRAEEDEVLLVLELALFFVVLGIGSKRRCELFSLVSHILYPILVL